MNTRVLRLLAWATLLLPLAAERGAGQQAIMLNHGILTGHLTWDSAYARLAKRFGQNVVVTRLSRDWKAPIGDQVDVLLNYANTSGLIHQSPVVAGHSLGGVVSRGLVRSLPSDAILTIGSPHQGHPVVNNRHHIVDNAVLIAIAMAPILELYDYGCPLEWYMCLEIRRLTERAVGFITLLYSADAMIGLTDNFIHDLRANGPFIDTLNSRVGNERVSERHNVVVEAEWSQMSMGPIPMLYEDPMQAWRVFDDIAVAGFYFLEYGSMLMMEVPIQAAAMMTVGWQMLALGDTWADAIGGRPHDGFIPVSSQHYPGAQRHDIWGIVHTDETKNAFFSQLIGDVAKKFGAQELNSQPPPGGNPPPTYYATIVGPSEAQPNQTCNWFVSTNLAYDSIEWRVNGEVAGYGDTLWYSTAGYSFDIEVSVYGNGTSAHGSKSVYVGFDAPYCAFQ